MVMLIGLVSIIAMNIFPASELGLHPFLTLIGAEILTGYIGGLGTNSIIAELANGLGNTWLFLSKVAKTDMGKNKSNIHRLIKLKDGSLVVNYSCCAVPYGIRTKIKQHISATIRIQIKLINMFL